MIKGRPVGLAARCCTVLALGASPALVLALAACAERENDPVPGAANVEEARALEEAAAMLEEQRHERGEDPALPEPGPPTPSPSS